MEELKHLRNLKLKMNGSYRVNLANRWSGMTHTGDFTLQASLRRLPWFCLGWQGEPGKPDSLHGDILVPWEKQRMGRHERCCRGCHAASPQPAFLWGTMQGKALQRGLPKWRCQAAGPQERVWSEAHGAWGLGGPHRGELSTRSGAGSPVGPGGWKGSAP